MRSVTGWALALTNDNVQIKLYGKTYLQSSGSRTMLCRNATISLASSGGTGSISASGDVFVCTSLLGENYITFGEGSSIRVIAPEDFNDYLNGIKGLDEEPFEACFVTEEEYNELYKDNPKFNATPYYSYSERTKEYTTDGHDTLSSDNGNPWTKYDSTSTTSTSGWTFTQPVASTDYSNGKKRVTSIGNTSAYYYWYAAADPSNTSDWCYYIAKSRTTVVNHMKAYFSSSAYAESRLRYFWYISSTIDTSGLANKGKTLKYCADSTVTTGTLSSSGTFVSKSTWYNYSSKLYYYKKIYKAQYVDTINKFWRWSTWSSWSGLSTEKKTVDDSRQEKRMYWIEKVN